MWNYYGSKSRLVGLYPAPKFKKIIEPFAGSARYALRHFEKDILLVDKYEVVVKIWKYLQACSPTDIMGLPKLKTGDDIRNYNLSEGETLFLGMLAGVATIKPRFKVSYFAGEQNGRKNKLKRIADQLFKIKHWEIRHGSFEDVPNEEATWFIDPPYRFGGSAYAENKVDYDFLSQWSVERNGQVIVCENTKADWLDFRPLREMRGANQKFTTEAFWTNEPTSYGGKQLQIGYA